MEYLDFTEEKKYIEITNDHSDLVKSIEPEDELFTVVVRQEFPDEECFDNPELTAKEPIFNVSRLEYLARSKIWNNHDHKKYDVFREKIKAHYASGFNHEPIERKEIETTFDMYADCEKLKHYPQIFNTEEYHWAGYRYWEETQQDEQPYYWRDYTWWEKMVKFLLRKEFFLNEQEFVEKMKEKYPEEYKEWFESFVFPTLTHSHTIMFDKVLPPLLSDIATRDGWTQFYFILRKDGLYYARGSGHGSGSRETHGYCGHAFAELANQGREITTYSISLDKKLKSSTEKFNTLKLIRWDLTGNYQISKERSRKVMETIVAIV